MNSERQAKRRTAGRRSAGAVLTVCCGGIAAAALVASLSGCRVGQPREKRITVPIGTTVVASLAAGVGTGWNRPGDPIRATTLVPVTVAGATAFPAGSEVRGSVTRVDPPGRVKGRARLTIAFDEIVDPTGRAYSIETEPLTFAAKSGTHDDIEKLAAGGITGAIIGGIVGGKSGALKGTVIGAGAGTVWVLATKGGEVEIARGQSLEVRITGPLVVSVAARSETKGGM